MKSIPDKYDRALQQWESLSTRWARWPVLNPPRWTTAGAGSPSRGARTRRGREITVVYPGRFQPWHAGHHDILRRIALGDLSVYAAEEDRGFMRNVQIRGIVVHVVDIVEPKVSNPLTVADRRGLIEMSVRRDPMLLTQPFAIRTDYISANAFSRAHLAHIRLIVPIAKGNIVVVSGNPATLFDAQDVGLRGIHVSNRDGSGAQSATAVRNAIVDGRESDIAGMLAPGGFNYMKAHGLFSRIRKISVGG